MTVEQLVAMLQEIGLSIRALNLLTIGMVSEKFIESHNNEVVDKVYCKIAG